MEELAARVIYKWNAGGKKPMLVGHAGCGKTAFVNYLGKKLGVKVKAVNLSTFEEIDMNGMPYLDGGKINISDPFWLDDLVDGDILFLDEYSNASTGVRNGSLQFILDKILPSGKKAPDLRIIGAMNPADDLEGYVEYSNAMKDRWAFMPFNFPVEEWKKLYKDNFGKEQTENEKKIRNKLIEFLNINGHLIENRKPLLASAYGITDSAEATPVEYAVPNRRNWDNLARELGQITDEKEMKMLQKNIFIENVGLECWRNYKEYMATETKPLDKYKWDGEPDEISQQINRLKEEKDLDKQVEYFERAYEYCKQKELLASVLPTVLKNCIGKYGLGYAEKYPKFKEIYNAMGA